jgi:hypothetical protein
MPQNNSKPFTYQTRLKLENSQDETLHACANLLSHVERKLFSELAQGKTPGSLKSEYIKRYRISARHFNACRVQVEGKISSIKERRSGDIQGLKVRIKSLEKTISKLSKKQNTKKKKTQTKGEQRNKAKKLHQKKRSLYTQRQKLLKLETDEKTDTTRLCFGSKKLFHEQFLLEDNGFLSFEDWKSEWMSTRNASFFLLGSKDETSGNQSCKASV